MNLENLEIDWIATVVSAIATLLMAVATFCSLIQNRKQLSELKRQWNEQNRPKLIALLISENGLVCLRLKNYSNISAHDIKINIELNKINNTDALKFCTDIFTKFEERKKNIENIIYILEPNGVKDLILFRDCQPGQTIYSGFLDINLSYNNTYKEKYLLNLSELNIVVIPPKPIQSSLNEISQKLSRL